MSLSKVERPMILATRGSALALAQAHYILEQCRAAFPGQPFEMRVIKTTGDRLQSASLARPAESLPKGLFTKELEVALLKRQADLAVHSLKDLPTSLPEGLQLGAVSRRADVRDVLIYRGPRVYSALSVAGGAQKVSGAPGRVFGPGMTIDALPVDATVATSSTRRKSQILALRPDIRVLEIRGNVATRLRKLLSEPAVDATILAAAGLERLGFEIQSGGELVGAEVPEGFLATVLSPETMLPCVGQGALGIEIRADDERAASVCTRLDDEATHRCVLAERAFLRAMGGGCQSPVGALAEWVEAGLCLRAVSFHGDAAKRGERRGAGKDAEAMGEALAGELLAP